MLWPHFPVVKYGLPIIYIGCVVPHCVMYHCFVRWCFAEFFFGSLCSGGGFPPCIHPALWTMNLSHRLWGAIPQPLSQAVFVLSSNPKHPISHSYLLLAKDLPDIPPVYLTLCLYNWLTPQGFTMWYPNSTSASIYLKIQLNHVSLFRQNLQGMSRTK